MVRLYIKRREQATFYNRENIGLAVFFGFVTFEIFREIRKVPRFWGDLERAQIFDYLMLLSKTTTKNNPIPTQHNKQIPLRHRVKQNAN